LVGKVDSVGDDVMGGCSPGGVQARRRRADAAGRVHPGRPPRRRAEAPMGCVGRGLRQRLLQRPHERPAPSSRIAPEHVACLTACHLSADLPVKRVEKKLSWRARGTNHAPGKRHRVACAWWRSLVQAPCTRRAQTRSNGWELLRTCMLGRRSQTP